MKYRAGQEVIFVGPVSNPMYDGPPPNTRVTITEAPLVSERALVEDLFDWSPGVEIYQFDGEYYAPENMLRPIPDELADEEFVEWLKSLDRETAHA